MNNTLSDREFLDRLDNFKEKTLMYIRGLISIDDFRDERDEMIKSIKLSKESYNLKSKTQKNIYVSSGYNFKEVSESKFLYDFEIFKNDCINNKLYESNNIMFDIFLV